MLRSLFYQKPEKSAKPVANTLIKPVYTPPPPPPEYRCSSQRKLECIALIITTKEVESGRFKKCVEFHPKPSYHLLTKKYKV